MHIVVRLVLFNLLAICAVGNSLATVSNPNPNLTVRMVSGFSKPSKVNEAAFLAAIEQITAISATLLNALQTDAHPKNRGEEVAKARVRYVQRFPG